MYPTLDEQINNFLTSEAFAVIGASSNRDKYGNKVLRCYLQHKKTVYPVNNHEQTIEGLNCIDSVTNLPEQVKSISIVTPPKVTEKIMADLIAKGIKNVWMQPGAESDKAIAMCQQNNINVIFNACILVTLGYKD